MDQVSDAQLTFSRASKRILIFNQQGQREINELLEGVYKETKAQGKFSFDHVIFCPTIPAANTTRKGEKHGIAYMR